MVQEESAEEPAIAPLGYGCLDCGSWVPNLTVKTPWCVHGHLALVETLDLDHQDRILTGLGACWDCGAAWDMSRGLCRACGSARRYWGRFGPGLEVIPPDWRSAWEKCPGTRAYTFSERSPDRDLCPDCHQWIYVSSPRKPERRRFREHWRMKPRAS